MKTNAGKQRRRNKSRARDPMLSDVAFYIRESGVSTSYIMRKTGLTRKTVNRLSSKDHYWPGSRTKHFALAAIGYEMTIRRKGSNI